MSSLRRIIERLLVLMEQGDKSGIEDFFAKEILTPAYTSEQVVTTLRVTYTLRHEIPAWYPVRDAVQARLKEEGRDVSDYMGGLL